MLITAQRVTVDVGGRSRRTGDQEGKPAPAAATMPQVPRFWRGARRALKRRVAFFSPAFCRGGLESVNRILAEGLPSTRYECDAISFICDPEAVLDDSPAYDDVVTLGEAEEWGKPAGQWLRDLLRSVLECRGYSALVSSMSIVANEVAHELGIPVIEYWHGSCLWNSAPKPADRILAVSEHSKADMLKQRADVVCPVEVVYNAVDWTHYAKPTFTATEARKRFGLRQGQKNPVLVWCGRLSPEKRPEDAIAVTAKLKRRWPGLQLLLVGSSYFRPITETQYLAQSLGLEWGKDVVWRSLPREQVVWAYHAADVMLSTSSQEGFGMAIAEAMASGVPVVSTGAGGSREVTEECALYADVGDVDGLASQVGKLLDQRRLARDLGTAGQERARVMFDLPVQRRAFRRQLEEVIECRK